MVELGDREFRAFRDLIRAATGIKLEDNKRGLVENRLSRRLTALALPDFAAYLRYLDGHFGEEQQDLINAITTNKTSFFREAQHFRLLKDAVFPAHAGRPLRIWSAGCSTGEEPYTLAMTALEAGLGPPDVQIVASDIDTEVLAIAQAGIYGEEKLEGLEETRRRRFFLRGRGRDGGKWKVKPELSRLVHFRQVNLTQDTLDLDGTFDVIFCRNVVIYFDKETQRRLFDRFADKLATGGYLFIGHSESLLGLTDRFEAIEGTAYRCLRGVTGNAPVPGPIVRKRIVVGEVFASREPVLVSTLLGSCVSACLFDEHAQVGGMNHFLLPDTSHDDGPMEARYGVHAMERLINDLLALGARRSRLKAKVFGASQIGTFQSNVQARNATFVREYLKKESIPVVAERLLGNRPLEVQLRTDTGQAFVRLVNAHHGDLARQEMAAARKFLERVAPSGGSVELF
jgi:chemotaxis protein methyltransferase CheR